MQLITWLVEAGADVTQYSNSDQSPLLTAACLGREDIFEYLARNCPPDYLKIYFDNYREILWKNLFYKAIDSNDIKTVNKLICCGININLNQYKWSIFWNPTFLVYAVLCDSLCIVKILLEAGANPNIKDEKNNSALSLAKQLGNYEIIQLLINAGATEE